MTRYELAQAAAVSYQAIAQWESGAAMPTADKLPTIAANAEQDACTPENPRETKAADFEKILKACYYDTDIDF